MDNQTFNYVVFFILLLTIIYTGCVDRTIFDKLFGINEKFVDNSFDPEPISNDVYINNNSYNKSEGTHYKLKTPLVSRLLEEPRRGWKGLYKNNYLKGNVNYGDSFDGIVTRNYLDNMQFFVN
tara:strand:+ start:283 stop:651 length:369 start_codon:yes stop_codon:yes gene_type:complete